MAERMHKAILFDLGKVLVHFDFQLAYLAMEERCPYSPQEIRKRLLGTGLFERFESGLMEPREFVGEMCRRLELRVDYDQFCGIWSSIFTDILIPEEMLAELARNYRLVLVSNTNALHFAMIRRAYGDLLKHFHSLVLSYEVRAMKPAAEIFQRAVDRAGCRAEECFYADDIGAYVEGARRMGDRKSTR